MVRRVARNAADVVLGMHGINGIHVLRAARMARHATVVNFLSGGILKGEYLRDVAATRNVSRTGAVAILAAVLRDPAFLVRLLPVRALLPAVVNPRVTGLAGFRADVF